MRRAAAALLGHFGALARGPGHHDRGSTALYDAIYVALSNLAQTANPNEVRRQALAILSDGIDTSSLLPHEDVLDAALRHGVTIYAVSPAARRLKGRPRHPRRWR